MIWQDATFALGSVVFMLALVPTITNKRAGVPRGTSITTALTIAAFATAHASINFQLAAGAEIITSLVWGFIAWHRPVRAQVVEYPVPMRPIQWGESGCGGCPSAQTPMSLNDLLQRMKRERQSETEPEVGNDSL